MRKFIERVPRKIRVILAWILCLILMTGTAQALEVNALSLNLVEHPTANKNIFGTSFNALGYVQSWGSDYMKYDLTLTSDPAHTFQHLYIQVYANRGNQNNDPQNSLRFALFGTDPVANNLDDSDAIVRTAINQVDISPTFTNYIMGPASGSIYVEPVNAGNPPNNKYYLMIYAGGAVANQGYGLKIDQNAPQVEYYAPDDPNLVVQYWNGTSLATSTTFTPSGTPVPEPSVIALGGAAMAVLAFTALRKRLMSRCRN